MKIVLIQILVFCSNHGECCKKLELKSTTVVQSKTSQQKRPRAKQNSKSSKPRAKRDSSSGFSREFAVFDSSVLAGIGPPRAKTLLYTRALLAVHGTANSTKKHRSLWRQCSGTKYGANHSACDVNMPPSSRGAVIPLTNSTHDHRFHLILCV